MERLAVVVFNLGGPDEPDAIEPFLFNLFNDPAIIGLPGIFRTLLAKFISWRRAPVARHIYSHIGGRSPLLEQTQAQANALQEKIGQLGDEVRVFVAMRYWHPFSEAAAREVKAFGPDKIVLLPLYPQFSTTTTGSSLTEWDRVAKAVGLDAPTRAVCCYGVEDGYIKGLADLVQPAIAQAEEQLGGGKARVLFSAHGLPEKIIKAGDPYQWQIEQTSAAVAEGLAAAMGRADLDWTVCYQSRVGRLKWIEPSLGDELERAGRDGVGVVVIPIAFVSEHSETLVELDIEYRAQADELGIPVYVRVPTLGVQDDFVGGLARTVEACMIADMGIGCQAGERRCPPGFGGCPLDGA
ncbi:MAG: ferrochelatase [Alphaproteobacteria bacterium]|jgi:protoporphyrin/coproporphyrin ferrochelatase|nr:ferrochelatase [Alphaproteobacteria bacterium]MBT7944206.1 ferrochelatase [Alphaproteobacteria bacterium]